LSHSSETASKTSPNPKLSCDVCCGDSCAVLAYRVRCVNNSMARAAQMQSNIRVVKQQPTPVVASLLDGEFSPQVGLRVFEGRRNGSMVWSRTSSGSQQHQLFIIFAAPDTVIYIKCTP